MVAHDHGGDDRPDCQIPVDILSNYGFDDPGTMISACEDPA